MNRLLLVFFFFTSSLSGFSQSEWIGSIDNDWFNGPNWNTGVAPSITDDVIIQPGAQNYPIIVSPAVVQCSMLTIMSGSFISITTGTLEAHGDVNNEGAIIIGSGNFISNVAFFGNGGAIEFTDNGKLIIKHENVSSFGDLDANQGTVVFNASGLPQSIEESEIFANLKIDNAEGLQLNKSIEINNALVFADGLIYSSNTHILRMNASSSIIGVSDASHVVGQMEKVTNSSANFTFPIGDNNNYMGLTISPSSSNLNYYKAKFDQTNLHPSVNAGSTPVSGMDHVSELYWWNLQGPTCDVGLNWNTNSFVDDFNNIVLATHSPFNAQWEVAGNSLTGGSSNSSGTVYSQSGNLGNGDYTLGSVSSLPNNPFILNVPKTYVPDDDFEQYLETHNSSGSSVSIGDPNSMGDGIANNDSVITARISSATWLDLSGGLNVEDITGIADFTSLTQLNCNNNLLTDVDFTSNTAIEEVYCDNNQIDSINVNSLTNLNTLTFNSNPLKYLNCANSGLNFLDFTSSPPLETLIATGCTGLTTLHVTTSGGNLSNLQITGASNLTFLDCRANSLTTLDLTSCSSLSKIICDLNQLTTLDLSPCSALEGLSCKGNLLTALDFSNNSLVDTINFSFNNISSLVVSNLTALKALDCSDNSISSLDLSSNSILTALNCENNSLNSLDLRNGNNTNLSLFNTIGNSPLECVSVDNSSWSSSNWTSIDTQTFFSNNCAGIPVADFVAYQTAFCQGPSVTFNDISTNSPTSWSWDFGDGTISSLQNPTHTYLQPGTFTVSLSATNANGATTETKTDYITVYPNPVVSSITPTALNCNGSNDGAIDLTFSSGSSPYSFSWDNGATTEDISNLPPGTYTVSITDNFGCTVSSSTTVAEPAAISVSESIANASCNASCDGSITLSVTGGNPGYSFYWNSGETTQDIDNLCAGSYSVDVTDNSGCLVTKSYTVTQPAAVPVNAGSDITICEGGGTTLSASGTNSYSWNNGLGSGQSHLVSPVVTTTYIVTGTDASGWCSNTDTVIVTVNASPNVDAGPDLTLCQGGSVTLFGSGAISYSWDNGVVDGVTFVPSNVGTSSYNLVGTDANGCQGLDSLDVTVNPLPIVGAGLDNTICEGNPVTLSGSGANSYSWNNGVSNGVSFTPAVGTLTYIVLGTDLNGCSNVDSVIVSVNSTPQANAGLDFSICEGASIELFGQITSGGNPPYTFSWDNGVTDGVSFVPPVGTTTYNLTVTDLFLCSSTDNVVVFSSPLPVVDAGNDFEVCPNEPIALTASGANFYTWNNSVVDGVPFIQGTGSTSYVVTGFSGLCSNTDTVVVTELSELVVDYQITHAECDSANGSVLAVVLNPTAPNYYFHWGNGDLDDFAEDLSAGPINIMISDVQCQYYDVVLVGNSNIGPVVNVNNVIDESCPGASDGEIQLIVTSSNPPYNVSWLCAQDDEYITNLPAGLYQYTVTDQSSCITSGFVHVDVPDSLEISSVSLTSPTCGLSDGSISLGVTGGSGAINYSWSANTSGQTGSVVNSLAADLYGVTISDGTSCNITETFELNNLSSLSVGVSSINSPLCGNTGSINVFASGGTAPYSYLWNNGDTTQNLNGIVPGNYSLAITDSLGCLSYFNQELSPENPFNPGICMVTVDSISENNIVIWEKPLIAGSVSHYNIYRECCSSGLTNYLTSVPYDSLSEYMDTTCLPQSTNWSYQLSVVDTCGVESPKSATHRSIHISSFLATNTTVGLYWNQYVGFPYTTHYIYRNHPSTGMLLIDSVDYAITSYIDPNPITPLNDLSYMIEVIPPSTCTSTKAVDHNSARSNRESGIVEPGGGGSGQSINEHLNGNLSVYPNPTNSSLTLTLNQIDLPCVIALKDLQGRVVYSAVVNTKKLDLDLSSYQKGIYLIGVVNHTISKDIKVIKN